MDTRYSRRIIRTGNQTAEFSCSIPEMTEKISGFYRELAEACERFCEDSLGSIEEYRGRGCRLVRYSFEVVEERQGEDELVVLLRVESTQGGRREILFEERHRWSISDGVMLLPIKKREKGRKRQKALKKIKNIEKSS